jgi:heme-degrading monooxygenase HmoA
MAKLVEIDESAKFRAQLEEDVSPVVFLNQFHVKPEDFEKFLTGWQKDAEFFKSQPGFISAQLHKGIGVSGIFINYTIWESTTQFRKAVDKSNFQTWLSNYPDSTIISPHLFKKVAVPGICVE